MTDSTHSSRSQAPAGSASNNVYNVADFLFGTRSAYSLTNVFTAKYRQRMNFFYLQDDWKFSPKLTLNLGVRYEYATPQWEDGNHLANYDLAAQKPILAKSGGIFIEHGVHFFDMFAGWLGAGRIESAGRVLRPGSGMEEQVYCTARYGDERWMEILVNEPLLLKIPLVRHGNALTIGAAEATWKSWLAT